MDDSVKKMLELVQNRERAKDFCRGKVCKQCGSDQIQLTSWFTVFSFKCRVCGSGDVFNETLN